MSQFEWPLIFSGVAVVISALTYWRNGKWKETDEGKALLKQVQNHETRIGVIENEIEDVAKSGDIDALREKIDGLKSTTQAEVGGVKELMIELKTDLRTIKNWTMRDPA